MYSQFTKYELNEALTTQRASLITIVGCLSSQQLQHPSLCAGWKIDNVLGHILGFELSRWDFALLLLRFKKLDDITANQAARYAGLSAKQYVALLNKGIRRTRWMLRLTPAFLLNIKWVPVPHGRLSMGQLYGDLVLDRAIHMLDITHPLGLGSVITDSTALRVALRFVLCSMDLLEPKIPVSYRGKIIRLHITGTESFVYDWRVGGSQLPGSHQKHKPVLTVRADANDLLFTLTGRKDLILHEVNFRGDQGLAEILKKSLNANALWDSN